jgi:Glycosyl transferase family 2
LCAAVSPARETIAACLIVKDEQQRLPAALGSVAFCDELIVVDSGSCDRTTDIAREANARVVEHPWEGFGKQRNVAIDHVSADWILEVDADERITSQLARELLEFLADPPSDVAIAALPMREWFLGRLLGPSIKYPRYRTRLFRRGAYRHDERRSVHEGIWPAGPVWVASGDMHHVLADSLREALVDWWRYASLQATHVQRPAGPLAYARAIVLRPAIKFAYRMLVDAGWRDGAVGTLKVLLDCSGDSLVWLLCLSRRDEAPSAGSQDASQHFGREQPHRGPVRLVALAAGAQDARDAVAWLARARRAGADVALVTDTPQNGVRDWLFTVPLRRMGPLALLRALDAVEQARPFDCIVASGRPRLIVERLLPRARRGLASPQSLQSDPATVVSHVTALARPGGAEPTPGVSV